MALKTTPFDPAEYLETDEDIKFFLQFCAEEDSPEEFVDALNTAARAIGMTEIAKKAGLARASLYKSLLEGGNPRLETINRVCAALGVSLADRPLNGR